MYRPDRQLGILVLVPPSTPSTVLGKRNHIEMDCLGIFADKLGRDTLY